MYNASRPRARHMPNPVDTCNEASLSLDPGSNRQQSMPTRTGNKVIESRRKGLTPPSRQYETPRCVDHDAASKSMPITDKPPYIAVVTQGGRYADADAISPHANA